MFLFERNLDVADTYLVASAISALSLCSPEGKTAVVDEETGVISVELGHRVTPLEAQRLFEIAHLEAETKRLKGFVFGDSTLT
ncbi:MAG: hypothetical protein M3Q36_01225 [bacterium]|nr:hypothetical protein [bacterium]